MQKDLKTLLFNHLYFKKNIFVFSFLLFSFLVIFGTLSHEFGHVLVAQILGYETTLHFGSMSWFKNGIDGNLIATPKTILWITLGGVFQTLFTGTLGLVILQVSQTKISFWLGVSLSLFWSREIINLTLSTTAGFLFQQPYFGGDELIISNILGLPAGFVPILLGAFGLVICSYVLFKIELVDRLSFVLGGFFGGKATYILWFSFLGEKLLP